MATRYGPGELFGRSFADLSTAEIRDLSRTDHSQQHCPFREGTCSKAGGVCSLRMYSNDNENVGPADERLVTTCPHRFLEGNLIHRWIGNELLGSDAPEVVKEVPFLRSTAGDGSRAVGMIDMVLVNTKSPFFEWCALEMQAVYFSGKSMSSELRALKSWDGPGIPFPTGIRRPDFRSSGPKRLMPQLQVKVPTLSRWGKKTAVVVDEAFWQSLSPMDEVEHVSNCDIAWFVINYRHKSDEGRFQLDGAALHHTTLDHAVKGLTGGIPSSREQFEAELRRRLDS